jgi:hypothetical protein
MASMQSIARLYAAEPKGPAKRTEEIAIEATHEKVPSPVPLPTTERLRGFRRATSEQTSYQLTQAEIWNIVEPGNALDRSGDFACLAARDQFLRCSRARSRRATRR